MRPCRTRVSGLVTARRAARCCHGVGDAEAVAALLSQHGGGCGCAFGCRGWRYRLLVGSCKCPHGVLDAHEVDPPATRSDPKVCRWSPTERAQPGGVAGVGRRTLCPGSHGHEQGLLAIRLAAHTAWTPTCACGGDRGRRT